MDSLGHKTARGCPLWRSFCNLWLKMAETINSFWSWSWKNVFFSQKSVVKTSKIPLCTPENTDNNFELHDGSAKPISSWWKIAQNGKKCTKVENGVSRKRQVLSSRSSYANQNAPTERTKGRSTKVCSGPWLLAPTVQKILPIFLKNHDFWAFSEGVFRVYLHTQSSPGKVTSYQS